MGTTNSYLKLKINQFTASFIIYHHNKYIKIIIAAGHSDNSFTHQYNSSKEIYDSHGQFYTYNGDSQTLYDVLTSYDPKKDKIDFLLCRLDTECDLQKYNSTWNAIVQWAVYVIKNTATIPTAIIGAWLTKLLGNKRIEPPSPQPYKIKYI